MIGHLQFRTKHGYKFAAALLLKATASLPTVDSY
jgi:hypothetical protein